MIEITVKGHTGSGKTAIGMVIKEALEAAGCRVTVADQTLANEMKETTRLKAALQVLILQTEINLFEVNDPAFRERKTGPA